MNWNYIFETIKYILENLCFMVALVSSLIFHHMTDEKRADYIEYTSVSKPILNIYLFLFLSLLLFNSLFPKLKLSFITKNIKIIESQKIKTGILFLLGIIYFASNNTPQLLQGMFLFVCGFAMSIIELLFDCTILKNESIASHNSSTDNSRIQYNNEIELDKDVKKNDNNPYNIPDDF
jgi:hypothetical protein